MSSAPANRAHDRATGPVDLSLALAMLRHARSPNGLLDFLESFSAAEDTPHVLARLYGHLKRVEPEPSAARALAGLHPGLLAAAMGALDHATVQRHLDRIILARRAALLQPYAAERVEDLLSNEK